MGGRPLVVAILAAADPANDPPSSLGAELGAARGCAGASCP
jgi:hypothetical protein